MPGRRSYEGIDIKVIKEKRAYADFFQEADVYTLDEYLIEHNVRPESFAGVRQKVAFIEKDWDSRDLRDFSVHLCR